MVVFCGLCCLVYARNLDVRLDCSTIPHPGTTCSYDLFVTDGVTNILVCVLIALRHLLVVLCADLVQKNLGPVISVSYNYTTAPGQFSTTKFYFNAL